MANIELVIKIPEELYNRFGHEYSDENLISKYTNDAILDAFCNSTPLPKGHGRLIDADALYENTEICHSDIDGYACVRWKDINDAPTIIEADKEGGDESRRTN